MTFLKENSLIIGLTLLIGVAVLLLSSSHLFFTKGVAFVDTDLQKSSGDEVFVKTKMDFGSQEHMAAFPLEVGQWTGFEYDAEGWKERLGADIMLMRGYMPQAFSQPVFFLIMQSETASSFHPPKVCYGGQGYKIEEEGKEDVVLTDTIWTRESANTSMPFKKLVIFKESDDGKITERRLVLYNYVKGNQFTTDTVTMLRISALIPLEGSYDGVLDIEKDFIEQALPLMFEPDEEGEKWNPIAREMAGWGAIGYAIIVLLVAIPLAIIIFPRIKRT
ncbi:MAG: exosortase-associated EpsI family protein [Chloroflexi bacterium]|nr:exosortase-associated EpsI family protein [Chloroflexota bacterium]